MADNNIIGNYCSNNKSQCCTFNPNQMAFPSLASKKSVEINLASQASLPS
jgi:hypothetical protein